MICGSDNFWQHLPRPIVGLAPMDGVTNAPYRYMTARYGPPDVSITEFVPVDGLMHNAVSLLRDFIYDPLERPVVAQVYGNNPQWFYTVAHLVGELGFDGIDINMGCPAKKVEQRGAGAGLIRTPDVAQAIVRATKQGVRDWVNGQTPESAGLPCKVIAAVSTLQTQYPHMRAAARRSLPVSVKTRIGYDTIVVGEWIATLLEVQPAVISVHGRTLKQMYRGEADWNAIAQAANLARGTGTLLLGNGDLATPAHMVQRIRETGVAGVLVGRASMGNPRLFARDTAIRHAVQHGTALPAWGPPSFTEMARVMIEHAETVERYFPHEKAFSQFFRLVKPYLHGFPDATDLRAQLYHAPSAAAVRQVLIEWCRAAGVLMAPALLQAA